MNVHKRLQEVKSELGEIEFKKPRDKMKASLKNPFKDTRVQEETDKFVTSLPAIHKPTAKELVRGIDESGLIQGKVQIGLLFNRGNNLQLLRLEWKGRFSTDKGRALTADEIQTIDNTGIKDIKGIIKAHEKARDGESSKYDERFFKPLHTDPQEYEWDQVKKK